LCLSDGKFVPHVIVLSEQGSKTLMMATSQFLRLASPSEEVALFLRKDLTSLRVTGKGESAFIYGSTVEISSERWFGTEFWQKNRLVQVFGVHLERIRSFKDIETLTNDCSKPRNDSDGKASAEQPLRVVIGDFNSNPNDVGKAFEGMTVLNVSTLGAGHVIDNTLITANPRRISCFFAFKTKCLEHALAFSAVW
jgi:hypothetical protein